MSTRNDDSYVELKYEFTEIVRTEIGFNELFAGQIAEAIVRGLSKRKRGQALSVPAAPYINERNEAIRRENNGRNREELCKKYEVSERTFYRIINGE